MTPCISVRLTEADPLRLSVAPEVGVVVSLGDASPFRCRVTLACVVAAQAEDGLFSSDGYLLTDNDDIILYID